MVPEVAEEAHSEAEVAEEAHSVAEVAEVVRLEVAADPSEAEAAEVVRSEVAEVRSEAIVAARLEVVSSKAVCLFVLLLVLVGTNRPLAGGRQQHLGGVATFVLLVFLLHGLVQ